MSTPANLRDWEKVPANSNQAVFNYINARLHADRAQEQLVLAARASEEAQQLMQAVWRHCRGAEPGVYTFKEHHRTCVVIGPRDHPVDYPRLVEIVVKQPGDDKPAEEMKP